MFWRLGLWAPDTSSSSVSGESPPCSGSVDNTERTGRPAPWGSFYKGTSLIMLSALTSLAHHLPEVEGRVSSHSRRSPKRPELATAVPCHAGISTLFPLVRWPSLSHINKACDSKMTAVWGSFCLKGLLKRCILFHIYPSSPQSTVDRRASSLVQMRSPRLISQGNTPNATFKGCGLGLYVTCLYWSLLLS